MFIEILRLKIYRRLFSGNILKAIRFLKFNLILSVSCDAFTLRFGCNLREI